MRCKVLFHPPHIIDVYFEAKRPCLNMLLAFSDRGVEHESVHARWRDGCNSSERKHTVDGNQCREQNERICMKSGSGIRSRCG
jgi:hypothetical protein